MQAPGRCEQLDITGLTGMTEAQRTALFALGAIDASAWPLTRSDRSRSAELLSGLPLLLRRPEGAVVCAARIAALAVSGSNREGSMTLTCCLLDQRNGIV